MSHPDRDHPVDPQPPEDPAVQFSRRTAFRFAAGAAGVAAVAAAGAAGPATASAAPTDAGPECAADLQEEN